MTATLDLIASQALSLPEHESVIPAHSLISSVAEEVLAAIAPSGGHANYRKSCVK